MISTSIQDLFVNNDICDCDQRCAKCGKLKRQNQQTFPQPYPYYPTAPAYPPQIVWTSTSTYPCTHQE